MMIHRCITHARACGQNAFVHTYAARKHPRAIIEELRVQRGFTSMRALALAAEISQPTLSRYMAGKTDDMETRHWMALAQTLGTTVSQLLGEVPINALTPQVQELETLFCGLRGDLQKALLATAHAMKTASESSAPSDSTAS